jgi:hypothetical protein
MAYKEHEKLLIHKSIFKKIIDKIKNNPLKNRKRPSDIPQIVPDCGWNHGEPKEK